MLSLTGGQKNHFVSRKIETFPRTVCVCGGMSLSSTEYISESIRLNWQGTSFHYWQNISQKLQVWYILITFYIFCKIHSYYYYYNQPNRITLHKYISHRLVLFGNTFAHTPTKIWTFLTIYWRQKQNCHLTHVLWVWSPPSRILLLSIPTRYLELAH